MTMSEKKNRNKLVILFFIFSIITIAYIINVFGPFGLIFWEIAFIFIIPNVIGIIWAARRIDGVKKRRIKKFKQIPTKYQNRLKSPGNYYDLKDVGYFLNRELDLDSDIPYGIETYQKFDKYEDLSISESNKPAVIIVHGGGSTTFTTKTSINYVWACRYFASLGFVSFSVEYTPGPVTPFPKGVTDVMKAIVHIKNNSAAYNIDNQSITLFGSSRGGHLVTQAAYTCYNNDTWWQSNGGNYTAAEIEVACVIDIYGAVDQVYEYEHNGWLHGRNQILFGGTYEEQQILYEKHTVKNYVYKDCPPTLILHGTIDGMVMIGESRELASALNNVGADYIFLEVPFGQHGFEAVPGTPGNTLAYYFIPRYILLILYS
jgi:acetyl esterase/lipase